MDKLRVLVTRPAGQAEALLDGLRQAGFAPLHQPALSIEPLPVSLSDAKLAGYRIILFVSSNAVRCFFARQPTLAADTCCLAVGPATAEALRQAGVAVQFPAQGFDSETLLALPQLQQVSGQPLLLCRGEGGRPLLATTLRQRGAQLTELALYRRCCASGFQWPAEQVAAVLINSIDSWQCIADAVANDCYIIAGSSRIADAIRASRPSAGHQITVARSPADNDMLAATSKVLNAPIKRLSDDSKKSSS